MVDLSREALVELAERVEKATEADNALDVLVEIALFEPGKVEKAIRANAAGTKVIYTDRGGKEETCWASDWTTWKRRKSTAAALRARSAALS
jgi:hypothetical protein